MVEGGEVEGLGVRRKREESAGSRELYTIVCCGRLHGGNEHTVPLSQSSLRAPIITMHYCSI